MSKKNDRMDIYFSVFNSHVNDAHKKAMKVLKKNTPEHFDALSKAHAKGIMSIFDKKPTPATMAYCVLVAAIANGDLK